MLTKTGLVVLAIVFCYPVLFLLTGSFMGQSELSENLGSVMGEATRYARWNFLPQNPTLKHYIEVLLDSPEYFVMFWNSIKVVMGTLVGQCTIAIPAAWGFAVYKFKFIYSILYKPCIFKAYRLLNVQTLCIFPCFCPYEPKQGKFLFSADYLIQQSCGSTLRFPCSVSVNVHCGTDISVSEKFLHIFRCCTV